MCAVDDGFGAFGFGDGVLDRPGVQPQLLGEVTEDRVVGVVDVAPHQRVVVGEVVGDCREVEIVLRLAASPHPAPDLAHVTIMAATRSLRGRQGFGVSPALPLGNART